MVENVFENLKETLQFFCDKDCTKRHLLSDVIPTCAILHNILWRQMDVHLEILDVMVDNESMEDDNDDSKGEIYDASYNILPQMLSHSHWEALRHSLVAYLSS